MKIVATDTTTINPGDLSWDELKKYGDVTIYDSTEPEQFYDRVKDAELILTNKAILYKELLDRLDKLKYVGVTATGINVIDLKLATEKGIVVTNVPAYGADSVAQHVFALILELTNNVGKTARDVAKGRWQEVGIWCYWDRPLTELAGKTLGIVGMGAIGKKVAEIGTAFGMKVVYNSPKPKEVPYEYVSINGLLETSDIVTLHCPLNDQTANLINSKNLALMKNSAILINTGRGGLVNETNLADALQNGGIAAAGLDVLSSEPPEQNPLIGLPNCLITPHQAWATRESRQRLIDIAIDNVRAFLAGERKNVVN